MKHILLLSAVSFFTFTVTHANTGSQCPLKNNIKYNAALQQYYALLPNTNLKLESRVGESNRKINQFKEVIMLTNTGKLRKCVYTTNSKQLDLQSIKSINITPKDKKNWESWLGYSICYKNSGACSFLINSFS